ncbi:MAG: hypothetical protein ACI4XM_01435 [Candidatus Coprovivens sp.]
MNKGFNTAVEETKEEVLNFINSKLQMGLPISVIGLIIDNVMTNVRKEIVRMVEEEKKQIDEENKEVEDK